jgi:flagellar basal-body rod protein FlgG
MSRRIVLPGVLIAVAVLAGIVVGRFFPLAPTRAVAAASDSQDTGLELRIRIPAGFKPEPRPIESPDQNGVLLNTCNKFDVAIEGAGFFQVSMPDGSAAYTRNGRFSLNTVGNLVTSHGHLISPQMTIPGEAISVSISSDGTASVTNAAEPNMTNVVGQLTLYRFMNSGGLAPSADGCYSETASSGAPLVCTPGENGAGLVRQGFLEQRSDQLVHRLVEIAHLLATEQERAGVKPGLSVHVTK